MPYHSQFPSIHRVGGSAHVGKRPVEMLPALAMMKGFP